MNEIDLERMQEDAATGQAIADNLAAILADKDAENVSELYRTIYKYTDCGAWIDFNVGGIVIGSIVEGLDFGTATYPLRYADNFTSADIQARINAVEVEAAALWKWANEGPKDSDDTWASIGLDAPDVDNDYQHLNPSGRSS